MSAKSLVTLSQTSKWGAQPVYSTSGALYPLDACLTLTFQSLKYHRLHPEYIHTRIEKLGHAYNLRVLLIMCDVVSTIRTPTPNSLNSFTPRASIRSQSESLPRSAPPMTTNFQLHDNPRRYASSITLPLSLHGGIHSLLS